MNAAQRRIVNVLKTFFFFFFAHQFLLMFVYLMCTPRKLFFRCGPETPKGWTPLSTDGNPTGWPSDLKFLAGQVTVHSQALGLSLLWWKV